MVCVQCDLCGRHHSLAEAQRVVFENAHCNRVARWDLCKACLASLHTWHQARSASFRTAAGSPSVGGLPTLGPGSAHVVGVPATATLPYRG